MRYRLVRSTRVPTAERCPADDQIPFPVTGHGPVFGLSRTVGDHDHARNLSSSLDPAARSALSPTGSQATGSSRRSSPAALDEQRLIDRLVAHPHHRIVWELQPQPAGDLLGRPPLLQPLGHLGGEPTRPASGSLGAWLPKPAGAPGRSIVASAAVGVTSVTPSRRPGRGSPRSS